MASRQSWVYPSDGSEPYLKGSRPSNEPPARGLVAFLPDLPDFVSPIDGKHYSGRAGMREHNLRHDVSPVADLKGLPYLQTNSDVRSSGEKRAAEARRKELIVQHVNKHYR